MDDELIDEDALLKSPPLASKLEAMEISEDLIDHEDLGSDPEILLGTPSPVKPKVNIPTTKTVIPISEESTSAEKDIPTLIKKPSNVNIPTKDTTPTTGSQSQPKLNLSEAVKTNTITLPKQKIVSKRQVEQVSNKDESCSNLKISFPNLGKRKTMEDKISKGKTELQRERKIEKRRRTCCIVPECKDEDVSYLKVHAFKAHIPGVFDYRLSVTHEILQKSRSKALKQAITWLKNRPASLEELVDFINKQHNEELRNSEVSGPTEKIMVAFCKYNKITVPRTFTMFPINNVAGLLH